MLSSNSSLFLYNKIVFLLLELKYQNILSMYSSNIKADLVILFRNTKKKKKEEK